MKICIDPGHSGKFEPGAVHYGESGEILEADLVLAQGLILGRVLTRKGHEVQLTRTGSIRNDGLAFRAEVSNRMGADCFISLHCNSVVDPTAHGTEVIHFPGSESGKALATILQNEIVQRMNTRDRLVKENTYQVLRETDCTAVLVELAFLSNDDDRLLLMDTMLRRGFITAIADGLEKYERTLN